MSNIPELQCPMCGTPADDVWEEGWSRVYSIEDLGDGRVKLSHERWDPGDYSTLILVCMCRNPECGVGEWYVDDSIFEAPGPCPVDFPCKEWPYGHLPPSEVD